MASTTLIIFTIIWSIFLLFLDVTILISLFRHLNFRKHPSAVFIVFIICSEISDLVAHLVVEFPSHLVGHPWIDCPEVIFFAIFLMYSWFANVLIYAVLANIHTLALYKPSYLKHLTVKTSIVAGSTLTLVALVFSLLYYVDGCNFHFGGDMIWQFNTNHTISVTVNVTQWYIEVVCLGVCCGLTVLMVVKLIFSRYSKVEPATNTFFKMYNVVVSSGAALTPDRKIEIQFARTFCVMVLIFLSAFVNFTFCESNATTGQPFYCPILTGTDPFLRDTKALVYLLSSPTIRSAFLQTILDLIDWSSG